MSDVVLKYCQVFLRQLCLRPEAAFCNLTYSACHLFQPQTQRSNIDLDLLMKCTRQEVMPSVSRKSALPLLKVAVAEEEKTGINLKETHNVLRSRCVEACVEEWKETLAKPLLALESRDKVSVCKLALVLLKQQQTKRIPLTMSTSIVEHIPYTRGQLGGTSRSPPRNSS